MVVEYLKAIDPKSCLELGCGLVPVVSDGDSMDKNSHLDLTYCWNALETPWPIEDKQYDVFAALQVWEHLKGKQADIFKELPRIANWAILSFPYKWKTEGSHDRIKKNVIKEWTSSYKPFVSPRIVRKRIIYVFKFSENTREDMVIKKVMKKI